MRRLAPRPLASPLLAIRRTLAPPTTIARVQERWEGAVGTAVSAEAHPLSERGGVLTVGCRSAVWAQELSLMGNDLLERLNGALDRPAGQPLLSELRFIVRSDR